MEAERRRRYYAGRRVDERAGLVVLGRTARVVVDASAHAAIEAGAGFAPYSGVVSQAERVSSRPLQAALRAAVSQAPWSCP